MIEMKRNAIDYPSSPWWYRSKSHNIHKHVGLRILLMLLYKVYIYNPSHLPHLELFRPILLGFVCMIFRPLVSQSQVFRDPSVRTAIYISCKISMTIIAVITMRNAHLTKYTYSYYQNADMSYSSRSSFSIRIYLGRRGHILGYRLVR